MSLTANDAAALERIAARIDDDVIEPCDGRELRDIAGRMRRVVDVLRLPSHVVLFENSWQPISDVLSDK